MGEAAAISHLHHLPTGSLPGFAHLQNGDGDHLATLFFFWFLGFFVVNDNKEEIFMKCFEFQREQELCKFMAYSDFRNAKSEVRN